METVVSALVQDLCKVREPLPNIRLQVRTLRESLRPQLPAEVVLEATSPEAGLCFVLLMHSFTSVFNHI